MRLSEAILLGDSLKKASNACWLGDNGECGCAFGGALLASGTTMPDFIASWNRLVANHPYVSSYDTFVIAEMDCVLGRWPWMKREHLQRITDMYQRVIMGTGTIEQVADYAKSVEPEEIKLTAEPQTETVTVKV